VAARDAGWFHTGSATDRDQYPALSQIIAERAIMAIAVGTRRYSRSWSPALGRAGAHADPHRHRRSAEAKFGSVLLREQFVLIYATISCAAVTMSAVQ
jgi:hypothetical protein